MRLFIAVEPSPDARRGLAAILGDVRRAARRWDDCIRWVSPSRMHLTLHFLGDIDPARLEALRSALGSSLPGSPVDVALGGIGSFASRGRLRALWIGVGAGGDRLRDAHGEIARRLAAGGWPVEGRPFVAHLTIGRVRPDRARSTAGLAAILASLELAPVVWRVLHVDLLSSDLGGAELVYTVRHSLAFAGETARPVSAGESDR